MFFVTDWLNIDCKVCLMFVIKLTVRKQFQSILEEFREVKNERMRHLLET